MQFVAACWTPLLCPKLPLCPVQPMGPRTFMAGVRQELAASTHVRLFTACYNKLRPDP